MASPDTLWRVDPLDPRAPPQSLWDQMSEDERAAIVDALPSDFPVSESSPPEGDRHYEAYTMARETLSRWFRDRGRRVYVSGNLPVYYPGETMFSPDVIAVMDVEPHQRESWIVSREGGRGLDFALEVIVSGRRRKDLQENVERYARLGIAEYFVFDRSRSMLRAYRLGERSRYERLMPQGGRYRSAVLELDLFLEGASLRFAVGDARLLSSGELVDQLSGLINDAEQRAVELEAALEEEQRKREEEQRRREEEQRRREEEQRKREEEQRKREESEREVERLRLELERLRAKG